MRHHPGPFDGRPEQKIEAPDSSAIWHLVPSEYEYRFHCLQHVLIWPLGTDVQHVPYFAKVLYVANHFPDVLTHALLSEGLGH